MHVHDDDRTAFPRQREIHSQLNLPFAPGSFHLAEASAHVFRSQVG